MEQRKKDHIEMALRSQAGSLSGDPRFYYEPVLTAHPSGELEPVSFLGKTMKAPLWISSMTGGTKGAAAINHTLAEAAAEYGLGMGLGSCRMILDDDTHFDDFNLRHIIGNDYPFFANLGVAQIEQLLESGSWEKIARVVDRLKADGLMVHINPLQEWLQPEGDRLRKPPLEIIEELIEKLPYPIIVKEVGQGMGPGSIRALLRLPVAALEFAAYGGTNFASIELQRSPKETASVYAGIAEIGHNAGEMVDWVNDAVDSNMEIRCKQLIVSGGIRNFLDGYYYMNKLKLPSIYGQASAFLRHALESRASLDNYVRSQIEGLKLAQRYLKVR